MQETTQSDFQGRVVCTYLRRADQDDRAGYSAALYSPRFEDRGGRTWLVGQPAFNPESSYWASDAILSVAWDLVSMYFVFESLESYRQAVASYRRASAFKPWAAGKPGFPPGVLFGLFRRWN